MSDFGWFILVRHRALVILAFSRFGLAQSSGNHLWWHMEQACFYTIEHPIVVFVADVNL